MKQRGFTLVELMVAMIIGSIIVLGSGQLFLSTFSTFNKVDEISRQQEAVVFIAQVLGPALRQSQDILPDKRFELSCQIASERCVCAVRDMQEGNQPLMNFYKQFDEEQALDGGNCAEERENIATLVSGSEHLYQISLPVAQNGQPVVFHVTNRQALLNAVNSRE